MKPGNPIKVPCIILLLNSFYFLIYFVTVSSSSSLTNSTEKPPAPVRKDLLFNYNGSLDSTLPFSYPAQNNESEVLVELDQLHAKCNGIDLREITVVSVQGLFATGLLKSHELVECYIKRIKAMNPYLNAVIEINPEAETLARGLDMERTVGIIRSPLHGVPILVKDNFATRDKMETTAGSLALVGVHPVRDADVVRLLRIAGAVILGKANLAEFSFFRGSNIPNGWSGRGGQTKSAYNLNTNPQGSSSGSAVSTSANLATVSIGTETDGSLISPASIASCVSMKPTFKLLSSRGVIPVSRNQDTAGPITRTVMDAAFVLDGMVAQHHSELQKCGGTYASCLRNDNSLPFQIGIPRIPFWDAAIANSSLLTYEVPQLNQLLEKIKTHHLIEIHDPVEASWDHIRNLTDAELILVLHDFKNDINRYLSEETLQLGIFPRTKTIRNLQDIIEYNIHNPSPEGYNQELLIQSQATDGLNNRTYIQARDSNRQYSREYLNSLLFAKNLDVIAVPSEPRYDVESNPSLRHSPFVGWTVAAISGYPSITVPAGYDQHSIPFGITFIGKPYTEVTLLRIAKIVEELWPARKPPKFLSTPVKNQP